MKIVNVTNARKNLYSLINEVSETYNPVTITSKNGKNVVVIPEEEWGSINETLYLYSVPGLVDKILESAKENEEEMVEYTDGFWDNI